MKNFKSLKKAGFSLLVIVACTFLLARTSFADQSSPNSSGVSPSQQAIATPQSNTATPITHAAPGKTNSTNVGSPIGRRGPGSGLRNGTAKSNASLSGNSLKPRLQH